MQQETLKEKWRLRLQLEIGTMKSGKLREMWCIRFQLWVAILRWWQSELHVRICVMRYCLAIYRRELLEHREEALRIEADWWDNCAEEPD